MQFKDKVVVITGGAHGIGKTTKETKMIKGVAHVALYTDKFEATIEFYKNAFEAVELGYFRTSVRGTWLKIGESVLEIFESDKLPEGSFKHIALNCDDVDEAYRIAIENGATSHVEPKDICLDLDEKQELRIAFVKGINGEQIELCAKSNSGVYASSFLRQTEK